MKKISFVLLVVFVAALAAGCSLFGGGDWKSGVVETLKAEHDGFTLETRYSMQESGLYYSILPVKLSYTPATADEDSWWQLTITQYDTMGFDSLVMNSVAIMNSRGDRFNVDYLFGGVSFGDETTQAGQGLRKTRYHSYTRYSPASTTSNSSGSGSMAMIH